MSKNSSSVELSCVVLRCVELSWVELSFTDMNETNLHHVFRICPVELSRVELCRVGRHVFGFIINRANSLRRLINIPHAHDNRHVDSSNHVGIVIKS
jgi:hypothetical protein